MYRLVRKFIQRLGSVPRIIRWAKRMSGVYRMRDLPKLLMLRSIPLKSQRYLPMRRLVRVELPIPTTPVYLRKATTDYYVLTEIYERKEYEIIKQLDCGRIRTVLDLGANIGLASRYIARLCPVSMIIAVEPDPDNCSVIRMNCDELLKTGKLKLLPVFVSGMDGQAGIDRTAGEWGFRMATSEKRDPQETIRCLGMTTILRLLADQPVDLLKCDIEGAEAEVFANCRPWINRVRYMIVETHPPYSVERLRADLAANDASFRVLAFEDKHSLAIIMLENLQWGNETRAESIGHAGYLTVPQNEPAEESWD